MKTFINLTFCLLIALAANTLSIGLAFAEDDSSNTVIFAPDPETPFAPDSSQGG